jgi:hypothetical protein
MTAAACSLDAGELATQLDRYRALGRLAAVVDYEPGRVVVRFADDPPRALIGRTLEVERRCCPFFDLDYQPATQRLAISVDHPDRSSALDVIARALTESRETGPMPDGASAEMPAVASPSRCACGT